MDKIFFKLMYLSKENACIDVNCNAEQIGYRDISNYVELVHPIKYYRIIRCLVLIAPVLRTFISNV